MPASNPILWKPARDAQKKSRMGQFMQRLERAYPAHGWSSYKDLHRFSLDHTAEFWREVLSYFEVVYEGMPNIVLQKKSFLDYSWFPNLKLNFAENLLRFVAKTPKAVALNFVHESGLKESWTYAELEKNVHALQSEINTELKAGEVLAAFMPNHLATVTSMLAATSLGGVFTSTSCDFGVSGVLDRFEQVEPKVLVVACGYQYNGKYFDLTEQVKEIEKKLPSVKKIIVVDFLKKNPPNLPAHWVRFEEVLKRKNSTPLSFTRLPFKAPLYIMYSSGTTGKPKCILHSIGGTLIQHLKELGLHTDLRAGEHISFFTTCGWMMWNWLVSSLALGAKVTLYEGSPAYPEMHKFLSLINSEKINVLGTSPKYLKAIENCESSELRVDFPEFRTLLSTGAPLLPEQFDFVLNSIKADVQIASISGGTDILSCFMLGNPLMPVRRGEIQCLGLGMDVAAFDSKGRSVLNEEGELVCKQTFPCQPLGFFKDAGQVLFKKAYFEHYPGVWHHGDYVQITSDGGVLVLGRSDATLNPGGVRIGTAEIYRQTEKLDFIQDCLCIGIEVNGDVEVALFVKMKAPITSEQISIVKKGIRENTTPRHVPKHFFNVQDIPYTRSGKKMEILIHKIFGGKKIESLEAVSNPGCLQEYQKLKDQFKLS